MYFNNSLFWPSHTWSLDMWVNDNIKVHVKFIYSEKVTKFCEISTLLLSYVVPVKSKGKISQNFVTFSEYMNFTWNCIVRFLRKCDFLKHLNPFVFVMLKKENQLLLGPLLMLLNSPENKLDKRKKRRPLRRVKAYRHTRGY